MRAIKRGMRQALGMAVWICLTPVLDAAPVFEPGPCGFALPSGRVEGDTVRCGALVVPENRDDPTGRSLRLAVAIFKNPGGATSADPIVYLSGGPGGSALEDIGSSFGILFGGLTPAGRDIVVFDQRGVGLSQPVLDCPIETATVDEWLACADTLRPLAKLDQYHTAANAADVEDLRVALGYARLNLWGQSYGTRLALDVLRDYPQSLRSVVLDSVYPPDVDLYTDTPANVQRAFDQLFTSCAADTRCKAAYPDLNGTLVSAVAALNAQPATIHASDPNTGASIELTLSGVDLTGVLFEFLYVSELVPSLPRMIHDAAGRRFDIIERYIGYFITDTSVSTGMHVSVMCHDEAVFSSKAAMEASLGAYPLVAPLFHDGTLGLEGFDICAGWGAGRAADVENAPVSSSVPTLLLAGEFDPITPPDWARRAARTLPNGRVYQFPTLGHGIGHDTCGRSVLLSFVKDPTAAPDAGCAAARRVAWVLPGALSAASVELRPAELRARLSGESAWRGWPHRSQPHAR
jgi:pimeloyl-ACP methyl ester carboxylesterase